MNGKKLFSIILLMSNLANIECHENERKTLVSLIEEKIYNGNNNKTSNNINTIFNNENTIYDINNYINDDFVNRNPLPLFIRGEMTEDENQYYLDRMVEIMNGEYMKPFTEETVEYNTYNTYNIPLVLDPKDKYTERKAQCFIDDLIRNGKILDKSILKNVANEFGEFNIVRFLDKYLSCICNIFNTLSNGEDILDYYDLLYYNVITVSSDELYFLRKIRNKLKTLIPNNMTFNVRKYNENYSIIIAPSINVLQKPISNAFKEDNDSKIIEKLVYDTNKKYDINQKFDNTFILDSIVNSVISIVQDTAFINDQNNKYKLLNNFSVYTKYIRNVDKMYIKSCLQELLDNNNSLNYDAIQYNTFELLVNMLKQQISNLPIELKNKNDLILSTKFNHKNLNNILKYSFSNNVNNTVHNKNMEIIIDTLNDENTSINIKHDLLEYITYNINSIVGNNNNEVNIESFKTSFWYLLEEESFHILFDIITYLNNNNSNYYVENTSKLQNCILDCFIKKMLESDVEEIGKVKFSKNVSEKYVERRIYVISKVLCQILGKKTKADYLFQLLNESSNEKHNKEFVNEIINFILENKIFKSTKNKIKQHTENLATNLKKLNSNIKNIFESIINISLSESKTKQDDDKKYILKKVLRYINNNQHKNNNQNNINNNQHNINEGNYINTENQNNVNNIESEIDANINNSNDISEQNTVYDLLNTIDQDIKNFTNINEDINNDPKLKINDTISLLIDNNINNISELTDFLNNKNNKQHMKTILNSMIDFITENKVLDESSIYNKDFINNCILKLNNTSLKSLKALIKEKKKNINKNTNLYKTYEQLLIQCNCCIAMNKYDSDSVEKLRQKRKRTSEKDGKNKTVKQSNIKEIHKKNK